jgi:matrixin
MIRLVRKPLVQSLSLLALMLFLVRLGSATTATLLSDEQLITSSRVILLGEIKSVKAQWNLNHENIETYVKVKVTTLLKGQLQGEEIVFRQLGGTVGDTSTVIFGAPKYNAGDRVLLFLDTARDGTLRIAHLFQGKYDVVEDKASGQQRVKRHVDDDLVNILGQREGPEITNETSLSKITKKIKRVLKVKAAEVSAYEAQREDTPIVETPPEYIDNPEGDSQGTDLSAQFTFLGHFRWFEPDAGQPVPYRVNQTGSPIAGVNEINQAFAAWTNVQTTSLVLQNAGSTTAFGFRQDGVTAISFNDPLDQMSDPVGCSGTLAIGGITSGGGVARIIGGQSFSQIFEGDVVFNRNFSCFLGVSANLAEVATHEIGHSIGFDHSPDFNAIMYASAHGNGRGPTLGADDIAAVTFLYPGSKAGPPPPPPPSYSGSLDLVSCNSIAGWAWDSTQPNSPINVDIYDGSTLIATVAANQFRQDLANAGLGNGIHGFSFVTPASLKNGQPHTIWVKFGGTSTALSGSPKTINCGGTTPLYQGVNDSADCQMIAGWAWDRNQPNSPINVDIYDGTTLIATVAANIFRQDLLNAGIGNGAHGFSFATPASLKNGQPHSIRVKFAGTSTDLSSTGRTINCGGTAALYQGFNDGADCQAISGWAWDRNQPNTPINVDIYDGTTLIATVSANIFRQDLLNAGIGNGAHGFSFATPASLKNGLPHSIRVKFAGTSTDLSSTGRTISCGGTAALNQGYLDMANCQAIAGWAWDRNQPNTPISVDIFDGTALIATVLANQSRPDLLAAGIGNGVHGYSFATPASLKNGQPHSIVVRFSGSPTGLSSSPKSITCP